MAVPSIRRFVGGHHLTLAVALVVALALLFGACAAAGGSGGGAAGNDGAGPGGPTATADAEASAGTAQAIDVCGLVTDAEFKSATTFAVKSHEAETGGGLARAPGCTWVLDTGSDMDLAGIHSISVQVTRPGGRAIFDALAGLPTLPGIGDGAFISGGNAGGDVWAVKGDALVHLQYAMPVGVDDANPIVTPLVQLVLSKI